jgi:hypothetical protein
MQLSTLIPFKQMNFQEGFKYLGFLLKPIGYGKNDLGWLLGRIERKIDCW